MNKTGILMENILQKTDIPADALRPIPELETTEDIDLSDESLSYVLANKLNEALDNFTPIAKELTGYGQLAEETNIKYVGTPPVRDYTIEMYHFDTLKSTHEGVKTYAKINKPINTGGQWYAIDDKVYYVANGTASSVEPAEPIVVAELGPCTYINCTTDTRVYVTGIINGAIYTLNYSTGATLLDNAQEYDACGVYVYTQSDSSSLTYPVQNRVMLTHNVDGKLQIRFENKDGTATYGYSTDTMDYQFENGCANHYRSKRVSSGATTDYYLNNLVCINGELRSLNGVEYSNAFGVLVDNTRNWTYIDENGFGIADGYLYKVTSSTSTTTLAKVYDITLIDSSGLWTKTPYYSSAAGFSCGLRDGKLCYHDGSNTIEIPSNEKFTSVVGLGCIIEGYTDVYSIMAVSESGKLYAVNGLGNIKQIGTGSNYIEVQGGSRINNTTSGVQSGLVQAIRR